MLHCVDCGGTKVLVAEWVKPNEDYKLGQGGSFSDQEMSHLIETTWCDDCDKSTPLEFRAESEANHVA